MEFYYEIHLARTSGTFETWIKSFAALCLWKAREWLAMYAYSEILYAKEILPSGAQMRFATEFQKLSLAN